ncbi:MAG TPA: urate hydroxylase PuuD [Planctomycetota bacterium]|jgi:uncharacterized membrane protein
MGDWHFWNTIVIPMLLRWTHVFVGIIWIGHLYFFNFVNASFEKSLDAAAKKTVVPQLRPRALWWFRWGAMLTMLSGVTFILWEQFAATDQHFYGWFRTAKEWWITFGGLLGLTMWFNVWFVIWPNQRIILRGIATGNKPADFDARVATAGKFSRINTYLSVPMLFGMGARQHFPVGAGVGKVNALEILCWMAAVVVVGIAVAWHLIYKVGPKVGTEFAAMAAVPPPPPPK